MKVKVLDLCVVDENDQVDVRDTSELFEIEGGTWKSYLESFNEGNLDGYNLKLEDVDKKVFIIDDGGELIRLKDGTYLNVCWRADMCRVWEEDDEEKISYLNQKLK